MEPSLATHPAPAGDPGFASNSGQRPACPQAQLVDFDVESGRPFPITSSMIFKSPSAGRQVLTLQAHGHEVALIGRLNVAPAVELWIDGNNLPVIAEGDRVQCNSRVGPLCR